MHVFYRPYIPVPICAPSIHIPIILKSLAACALSPALDYTNIVFYHIAPVPFSLSFHIPLSSIPTSVTALAPFADPLVEPPFTCSLNAHQMPSSTRDPDLSLPSTAFPPAPLVAVCTCHTRPTTPALAHITRTTNLSTVPASPR